MSCSLLVLACAALVAPGAAASAEARAKGMAVVTLGRAEAALTHLAQGQFVEAAQEAHGALRAANDAPTLHALAGAILLNTGDGKRALASFRIAVELGGKDGLARYGLGLAQLATGDRAGALASFQRAASEGGDAAHLLLAQKYAQWLGGAQVGLEGGGLPDPMMASLLALQGMAARQTDARRAAAALQSALESLPGEIVVQPGGLLMSFDAARPVTASARARLQNLNFHLKPTKQGALSGALSLTPEGLSPAVAYVSYEMDGQMLGLVNVRPFSFTWDTRTATNGVHTLTILMHDANGQEMRRAKRQFRTYNPGANPLMAADPERTERLRTALWQALALRPDRCACAYALGATYRQLGDNAAARRWLGLAAAIAPDYRDTRRQLALAGGIAQIGQAVFSGLSSEKFVALTFDDGPKPGITEPLLDILIRENAPSTFFVVGRQALLFPDLTRRIAAAGMEIANHSYTHPNLTNLPPDAVAREIMQTQAAVQAITGQVPRYLRPPGGNWNGEVARVAREWGLIPCFWTVAAYSAEVRGAQQVADMVISQVRPGGIVLLHNGKMSTVEALPTIIRSLRQRGYTFVTVETLVRRMETARETAREIAPPLSRME